MAKNNNPVSGDVKPIIGFDNSPMCLYCQKDYHVKPDCPVLAMQQKLNAERKAIRDAWEKRTYFPDRVRRTVRRGR